MSETYIHGYSSEEQTRLIQQAKYWQNRVILKDVDLKNGHKLLEIGCGVGAVLGILGQKFQHLQLAGIDLEAQQINYAQHYLSTLGLSNFELKVGDAQQLPWADNSFDYIYAIWFLEHLKYPEKALKEAYRVLKPEGKIFLTETDYRTILISPDTEEFNYLQTAVIELFIYANGNPYIGQNLGKHLVNSGFQKVHNQPWAIHYFNTDKNQEFADFINYIDSCTAPTIPQMVTQLGKDQDKLNTGREYFLNLINNPEAAITVTIYRATGIKN